MTKLATKAGQLLQTFAPAFAPERPQPQAALAPGQVRYAQIRAEAEHAREELKRRFSPSF